MLEKGSAPRGLIFDFDGLILDSETPVYQAWRECYAVHGHELLLERWVHCVGSNHDHFDPARELEKLCGQELDWAFLEPRRARRTREILDGADALPGVRATVEEAAGLGMPCAVASSSSRQWVDSWLEELGLRGAFHSTHCRDDVGRVKPDPELFRRAAGALGLGAHEVLVFEDSLNGLRAAQAAGMRCVVVPNAVTRGLDFTGAALLLESLASATLGEILEQLGW